MKLSLVSDVHLEFSFYDIRNTQKADGLILSGDIMLSQELHDSDPNGENLYSPYSVPTKHQRASDYRRFLKQCSEEFEFVCAIAGNHEFYNGKWVLGLDYLREEYAKYPNIHFLENNTVKINDVTFIGATLWTNMNKHDPITMHAIKNMMNDFRLIRHDGAGYRVVTPEDVAIRHRDTLSYFKKELNTLRADSNKEKVVIIGHHAPTGKSVPPMYADQTIMNGGYRSELSEFILDYPEIVLWTHGHMHTACQYDVGTTKVVCNPRGYQSDHYTESENTGWDEHMIIEV
jgi:Icc-related predicted phosphoesterase